ncbi:MAG: co-chaperone DjlA [Spirochaetia bacterium]|jgi:DnaJ like chaperone protein|nr:co-chaperone DjlA [Spirochaetia bacterium]
MAWLGKLIGGAVGFTLGGPLGMIAGIAFGNMFDHAGETSRISDGTPYFRQNGRMASNAEERNMTFFLATFSLLARLAQADGVVSEKERNAVNAFIDNDLKLDYAGKQAALRIFNTALTGGGTVDQFASQFYQNFANDQALLQLMVDILFRVGVADGRLDQAEEKIIRRVVSIFRFSDAYFDAMVRRYAGASVTESAYTVLGLTSQASDEEVKKAYRKMSIEYHPDTVQAKGLPDDFVAVATKKFREIQEAYETIKKERGIK